MKDNKENTQKKIKILFISSVNINDLRGDSIHVKELILNMSHNIDSITVLSSTNHTDKFKVSNIKFKEVKVIKIPFLMLFSFCIYAFLFGFFILLTSKYDIIYERHHIFGIGCILAKIFKTPCITEVNGSVVDEEKMTGNLKKIITKMESNTYSIADKIITVTPGLKEIISIDYNISDNKIVTIENGANTDLFKPADQNSVKRQLILNQNINYICFVGSLAPWQGVEYLIQAAPYVLSLLSNVRFLIIGDGAIKNKLIQLSQELNVYESFIFTGNVPFEQIPLYINASDICVVYKKPLKSGYSPLKLYEYMACRKPIVASRVRGFEVLEQQNAGFLVESESPEELAKVIVKLLKDEKLREQMGINGRNYVVKDHSWKIVAQKVVRVCESVVLE